MENAFGGLISRLESEFEEVNKNFQDWKSKRKKKKKDCKISKLGQNVQELCNNYKKGNIHLMEIPER